MDATDRHLQGLMVLAVLCAGCGSGASGAEDTAAATGAATVKNGLFVNGTLVNGVQLGPLGFDGFSLRGQSLTGVALADSSLSGTSPGGPVSGSGLVGAEIAGTLSSGASVTLRIDGVATGSAADVQLYTVSASADGGLTFQPLCGVADGAAVQAIPLVGSWDASEGTATGGAHVDDPTTFTFACDGYALAKCVEFGYAPWRSVTECNGTAPCVPRSLASFHQACTRLLRADYCGDGTPTTRDGTQVDLWDVFGIQTDDAPTWSLEAEWSPDGAVCVDETRWATLADGTDVQTYIQDHCPSRWQTPGCGTAGSTFFTVNGFGTPLEQRSLLRTRIPEQE